MEPTNPRAVKRDFVLTVNVFNITDEELTAMMETFETDILAFGGTYVWQGNEVPTAPVVVNEDQEASDATDS